MDRRLFAQSLVTSPRAANNIAQSEAQRQEEIAIVFETLPEVAGEEDFSLVPMDRMQFGSSIEDQTGGKDETLVEEILGKIYDALSIEGGANYIYYKITDKHENKLPGGGQYYRGRENGSGGYETATNIYDLFEEKYSTRLS